MWRGCAYRFALGCCDVEEKKKELKEKLDKAVEVKMLLELSVADTINVQQTIIDVQEIKLDEYRSKLRKMRRYASGFIMQLAPLSP